METDGNLQREFWTQVAAQLRERLSTQDYCSWFSGAGVRELGPEGVVVEVVNDFAVRWIEQHFGALLRDCIELCAGTRIDVQLVAAASSPVASAPSSAPVSEAAASTPAPRTHASMRDAGEEMPAQPRFGSAMTEAELLAELARDDDPPSRTLAGAPTDPTAVARPRHDDVEAAQAEDPRALAQLAGVRALDPRWRFDNFVIGAHNQMVHAAALAVAETPGQSYNPLFIHGGTGLGKTHLLHAIGHHVAELRPEARIACISTEQFLARFLALVHAAKTPQGRRERDRFKAYYRSVDLLLLDDVQFLAGRGAWMHEELFHLFNALHGAGKQIVLTSDCPPDRIPQLEARLRSRFAWGLIADLDLPDRAARIAILRRRAHADGITVPLEVLELLADHVVANVRELEGVFTRVVADASLRGRPITPALAERVLAAVAPGSGEPMTIERIQHAICDHFGLTRDELLSERRARAISLPRQIGMYLSRQLVDAPSTQVAARFNRRDHSTILHAEKKIDALMRADHEVHDVVAQLTEKLRTSASDVGTTR